MRRRIIVVTFVPILATAISALGQMTSHYSSYENITFNSDGNGHLSSASLTVTLEGYSSDCMCGALHTGTVNANIAGHFVSRNTGQHYPTYYMDISAISSVAASDSCWTNGCQITADEAMVDCTVIGSFYDSYGSGLGFVLRLPYQVEPLDVNSEFPVAAGNCPNSLYPGFLKFVTNQVQTSIGTPVAVDGLQVADIITTGSRRDLGSGTDTGSGVTTGDGSFQDRYSVCSSACPGSSGETDALQSWTVNGIGLPHVNGIIYKCSSIKVDGQ